MPWWVTEVVGERGQRADTGMTNFSAVCVAEKPTTLTSTSPAALPAAIAARSEISGRPFGRMIHTAPSGVSDAFSFSSRVELRLLRHAEEDRVGVLDDAADREVSDRALRALSGRPYPERRSPRRAIRP